MKLIEFKTPGWSRGISRSKMQRKGYRAGSARIVDSVDMTAQGGFSFSGKWLQSADVETGFPGCVVAWKEPESDWTWGILAPPIEPGKMGQILWDLDSHGGINWSSAQAIRGRVKKAMQNPLQTMIDAVDERIRQAEKRPDDEKAQNRAENGRLRLEQYRLALGATDVETVRSKQIERIGGLLSLSDASAIEALQQDDLERLDDLLKAVGAQPLEADVDEAADPSVAAV